MAVNMAKMNHKLAELQKRYTANVYQIEEKVGRTGNTEVTIVRKSVRRPHKTREQQKLKKQGVKVNKNDNTVKESSG